jgi:hypothetical protein
MDYGLIGNNSSVISVTLVFFAIDSRFMVLHELELR